MGTPRYHAEEPFYPSPKPIIDSKMILLIIRYCIHINVLQKIEPKQVCWVGPVNNKLNGGHSRERLNGRRTDEFNPFRKIHVTPTQSNDNTPGLGGIECHAIVSYVQLTS